MLSTVKNLPTVKTTVTAAIAALALMATAAAPVHAGQRERDFLKGVAATVIAGALIKGVTQPRQPAYAAPRQPVYQPAPQQPVYLAPQQPVYAAPQPHHGISTSAAAQAFKSYSPSERRAIQRQLARQGYYRGGVDGVFGPATFRAVAAYASDRGLTGRIDSASGAYTVYDSLIY
jgi:hypothetical protein